MGIWHVATLDYYGLLSTTSSSATVKLESQRGATIIPLIVIPTGQNVELSVGYADDKDCPLSDTVGYMIGCWKSGFGLSGC